MNRVNNYTIMYRYIRTLNYILKKVNLCYIFYYNDNKIQYRGQGAYGKSLFLHPNFAVNLDCSQNAMPVGFLLVVPLVKYSIGDEFDNILPESTIKKSNWSIIFLSSHFEMCAKAILHWLHHCKLAVHLHFLPAMSSELLFLHMLISVCVSVLDFGQSTRCLVASQCCVNLHFPTGISCRQSFYILI